MNTISISKSSIDQNIEESTELYSAFLSFYRIAFPDFDHIKSIKGFPVISENTAEYILDKLHNKFNDAFSVNMLWLNQGFSSDKAIPDWNISLTNIELVY